MADGQTDTGIIQKETTTTFLMGLFVARLGLVCAQADRRKKKETIYCFVRFLFFFSK